MYWGQKEFVGMVGGMTCRTKDSPAETYIDLRAAANRHRKNGLIGFGNTCCLETASAQLRVSKKRDSCAFIGPASYSRLRFGLVHPFRTLIYAIRRKAFPKSMPAWTEIDTLGSKDFRIDKGGYVFQRSMSFSEDFFDKLMELHLQRNVGLFCSRTAEELRWVFEEDVKSGRSVLICAYEKEIPAGYVIVKLDSARRRGLLVDWFACDNNLHVLESLVEVVKRYLRRHTPMLAVETYGFPTFVQPIIERHFPHERRMDHNMFSWGVKRETRDEIVKIVDTPASWFFGPYDGDACLS